MKQSTEVEQLLKPRYKVEFADYPNSEFTQGQIIEFEDEKQSWFTGKQEYVSKPIKHKNGGVVGQMSYSYFEAYPKVFRLMEWWEERKPEDMPQYLRIATIINGKDNIGEIIKAISGAYSTLHNCGYMLDDNKGCYTGFDNIRLECFLPATEEEFNNQNKKQIE